MEAPRGFSPNMTSLHAVVLDYVTTQAYSSTAKVLATSRPLSYPPTSLPTDTTSDGPGNQGDGDGDGDETMMDLDDDGVDDDDEASSSRKTEKRPSKGVIIDQDLLDSIERRRVILNHILNGAIIRAVEGLNTYFSSVLADPPANLTSAGSSSVIQHSNGHPSHLSSTYLSSTSSRPTNGGGHPSGSISDHSLPVFLHSYHPSHVRLNLQIQQFIESFRQLTPSSPSSPSSSISSLTNSQTLNNGAGTGTISMTSSSVTLTHALTAAQGLHSEAKKLPADVRAIYLQEIKDVGALFAYTDPETSILKGFLEQSRRIALADQINSAILRSEGRSVQSQLETYARRTTAVYNVLAENGIDPRPPWTSADGQGKEQLAAFWKRQTDERFRLRDFVAQSW
ncbi:hypothetical protein IAR55_001705 [Kwoniella newhampshirensis]|uniref:CRA domain-containing protein n=1 Tax=Kwoniella newhampshirensis TaxID=1651941 RepID=A0AAW0Z2X0_9TREE